MSATWDEALDQLVAFDLAYRAVEDEAVELLAKAGLGQEHFPTFGNEPKWPHEALPHERPRLPFRSVARRTVKAQLPGFRAIKINLFDIGHQPEEQIAFVKKVSHDLQLLFGFQHHAPYADSFTVFLGTLIAAGDLQGETRVTTLEFLLTDRSRGDGWHFTDATGLDHALGQALSFVRGMLPFWRDRLGKHLVPLPRNVAGADALSAHEAYKRALSHTGESGGDALLVEVDSQMLCRSRELEFESCDPGGRLLPWGAWRFVFETEDRHTERYVEVPAAGRVRAWAVPNNLHRSFHPHGRTVPDDWRDSASAAVEALRVARRSLNEAQKQGLQLGFFTETPDDDEDEDTSAPPVVPEWKVRIIDPRGGGTIVEQVTVSFEA